MPESLGPYRKAMMRDAIAAYASDVAGTRDDLDHDLESAALEVLQQEDLD